METTTTTTNYIPQVGDTVRHHPFQMRYRVTAVGERSMLAVRDGFDFEWCLDLDHNWVKHEAPKPTRRSVIEDMTRQELAAIVNDVVASTRHGHTLLHTTPSGTDGWTPMWFSLAKLRPFMGSNGKR